MSYSIKASYSITALLCLVLFGCDQPVGQQGGDSPYDFAMAQAEEQFQAAKDRCDNLSHDQKDICLENAQAKFQRDKENANAMNTARNPRITATSPQRHAEYEAALKECERLSGDSYQECIDRVKEDIQL
ncbi:hypothetical protein [Permianibacter aggregans]|uniref:Uncharacterized protein n=1 Tax=Permianibacter aggregans TaxID=1510150 RepID=A0A4R6UL57_9GAMM|nr:hypothetical protein [Permianibacter aggregans]QGX39284.1 hypothetical protein E2H98_06280 [Permianibacter aggregans]TDQ46093.1 hypothetical protein EV696_11587 [Permianibacter aggregans]